MLAHNLCVPIQEQHELGIEPLFRKADPTAVEPDPAILRFQTLA